MSGATHTRFSLKDGINPVSEVVVGVSKEVVSETAKTEEFPPVSSSSSHSSSSAPIKPKLSAQEQKRVEAFLKNVKAQRKIKTPEERKLIKEKQIANSERLKRLESDPNFVTKLEKEKEEQKKEAKRLKGLGLKDKGELVPELEPMSADEGSQELTEAEAAVLQSDSDSDNSSLIPPPAPSYTPSSSSSSPRDLAKEALEEEKRQKTVDEYLAKENKKEADKILKSNCVGCLYGGQGKEVTGKMILSEPGHSDNWIIACENFLNVKSDTRADHLLFLGYPKDSKDYNVFCPKPRTQVKKWLSKLGFDSVGHTNLAFKCLIAHCVRKRGDLSQLKEEVYAGSSSSSSSSKPKKSDKPVERAATSTVSLKRKISKSERHGMEALDKLNMKTDSLFSDEDVDVTNVVVGSESVSKPVEKKRKLEDKKVEAKKPVKKDQVKKSKPVAPKPVVAAPAAVAEPVAEKKPEVPNPNPKPSLAEGMKKARERIEFLRTNIALLMKDLAVGASSLSGAADACFVICLKIEETESKIRNLFHQSELKLMEQYKVLETSAEAGLTFTLSFSQKGPKVELVDPIMSSVQVKQEKDVIELE